MIEIIPTIVEHILELKNDLRPGELHEAEALGILPEEALAYAFEKASYCKTALVDGRVAAIWGVKGNLIGQVGQPFLVTGHQALRLSPLKITRIYLSELEKMKEMFPVLENFVDSNYYEAVRMLKLAGFTVYKPFSSHGKMIRKFSLGV